MVVFVVCSSAMDMACSWEDVTEVNKVAEMLDAEQALSSGIKESDISPKKTSELVRKAEKLPLNVTTPSSPNVPCNVNSNIQQHAKTKGTLRQQLHMKRQRLISSSVAVSSGDTSTDSSEKKHTASPNRAASQVNCLVGLYISVTGS